MSQHSKCSPTLRLTTENTTFNLYANSSRPGKPKYFAGDKAQYLRGQYVVLELINDREKDRGTAEIPRLDLRSRAPVRGSRAWAQPSPDWKRLNVRTNLPSALLWWWTRNPSNLEVLKSYGNQLFKVVEGCYHHNAAKLTGDCGAWRTKILFHILAQGSLNTDVQWCCVLLSNACFSENSVRRGSLILCFLIALSVRDAWKNNNSSEEEKEGSQQFPYTV